MVYLLNNQMVPIFPPKKWPSFYPPASKAYGDADGPEILVQMPLGIDDPVGSKNTI